MFNSNYRNYCSQGTCFNIKAANTERYYSFWPKKIAKPKKKKTNPHLIKQMDHLPECMASPNVKI